MCGSMSSLHFSVFLLPLYVCKTISENEKAGFLSPNQRKTVVFLLRFILYQPNNTYSRRCQQVRLKRSSGLSTVQIHANHTDTRSAKIKHSRN